MQHTLVTYLLILVKLLMCTAVQNNVCKTFQDYYLDPNNNRNCYFNPDVYLDGADIIRRRGYPLEIYNVTTKDGYILTVFRIPHGKEATQFSPGEPVFMQHGILSSASYFYFRGSTSLAFILADQGFDVWLGNFRGSKYSDKHKILNKSQSEYWNFSFHELGIYDLPAQLDLVVNVTRQKVVYLGYSMGTTAFYIYSTEFPDAAFKKIRLSISLAPVAFLHYITTPVRSVFPIWPIVADFLHSRTNGSFIRREELVEILTTFCLPFPSQMIACSMVLGLVFGYDRPQLDAEILPLVFHNVFDESSIKTFTHYIQLFNSGKFRQFDYGENNMEVYGSATPPSYQLSKMKVPNYLIRGDNDLLATKKNVELLYSELPQRVKLFPIYTVKYDTFSHSDFMAAKDIMELLYNHIIGFLKTYGPRFA